MTMQPPFDRNAGQPAGLKPSLDVVLKEGWRYAPEKRCFISIAGDMVRLPDELADDVNVVPMVPSLASRAFEKLSDDERFLARHLQVIFSRGQQPRKFVKTLRAMEPVDSVKPPRQVGLPGELNG
jgi:hypothetical protein